MKKKFAVAFFNSFEGELKLEIIEADSDLEAGAVLVSKGNQKHKEEILGNCNTLSDLQTEWLGDDFWIEVREIL